MSKYDYTLEHMKEDSAAAFTRASAYHAELKEIYRYFMPWRLPTTERAGSVGGRTEGASLGNASLFDSTGLSSAASFVANMQADWMPSHEPLFKLEAGPLYAANDKGEFNRRLETTSAIVDVLLGDTRLAAQEMFSDLFAGTGALLMEKGEKEIDPIRCVAVPPLEMAMEVGAWGKIERWHWKRNYKARQLPQLWPDAKYEPQLHKMIKDNRNADVEVTQYTWWDQKDKQFKLCAWTNIDKTELRKADYRTSPWITPRLFVVPGEAMGRGFAHLGLPTMKSLNKARELALRAAAFALLGLWIRRHDGVFNPDTAVMKPGAMWKVAHTSGPMKSIDRLDVPNNFDISHVVMNDEREQLRRVTLDDELPEMQDRVRSPTEIAGRMRRYDRNRGGNTVRLGSELITPIARRGVDICEQHGFFDSNLRIDQMITQATITAPAALAIKSAKAERFTSWMQIVVGLFGPEAAMMAAEVEKAIPDMARWLGVSEHHIRTEMGANEMKQMVAQYAAALAESKQAKAQQAKASVAPEKGAEAMYMNGAL